MMRSCEEYSRMLSAFLDGELSEAERAELLTHLDECEDCREELADLGAMSALLSPAEVDVPDGFSQQLFMRIRAEKSKKEKRASKWAKRLAPLAACAAVFTVVISVSQLGEKRNDTADFYALSIAPTMESAAADAPAAAAVTGEGAEAEENVWSETRQIAIPDCGSAKISSDTTEELCCAAAEEEYDLSYAAETDGSGAEEEDLFVLTVARTDTLAAWADEYGLYDVSRGGYCIDAAQFEALSELLSCSDEWSGRYDYVLLIWE